MFGLHKNRPVKSGERIDFKFSHFQALQVPKGWEKLFISVICVQTGKKIAKSSKALVNNGTCQWTETLSESIWVSQDDYSKELEDRFFKLLVAKGSARSGILGEAIVNVSSYLESNAPIPVSLPLKKCNYETILQVRIQCLTSRTKSRSGEVTFKNSHLEDLTTNGQDVDLHSDGSDSALARSTGSSSGKGSMLHPREARSMEASFSASGSHLSYDSEGSVKMEILSPRNNSVGDMHGLIGRLDSTSSQNTATHGNHFQNGREEFVSSSLKMAGSSKNLLEPAEDTIEELRAEAKMWERNARKLMMELEISRKELNDQSENQDNLNMELSAAFVERDGLKTEVEQLKLALAKSTERQTAMEDAPYHVEGVSHIQKELKDELKFQKQFNADLTQQLQRSQESNIELVSVLQELEDTIEKQKIEIENLLALQSNDMENSIQTETENNLLVKVQHLEQDLERENDVVENGRCPNNQITLDREMDYNRKSFTEEGRASLRPKLSGLPKSPGEIGSVKKFDENLAREVEVLKEKIWELERDCNELTDENLELLYKLKEATKNSMREGASFNTLGSEHLGTSFVKFKYSVGAQEDEIQHFNEKLNVSEIENNDAASNKKFERLKTDLEAKIAELSRKLTEKESQIAELKSTLLTKEEEIDFLGQMQNEFQAKFSDLQEEKTQLEEQITVILRESDITSKCLHNLKNDITVLSSSLDSHVSANKLLEQKSSELESRKHDLELHISELEKENIQLSTRVSGMEAQLKYLTDERESIRFELENTKLNALDLQGEISRLKIEMETEKVDLKEKLNGMQNRYSEVQEQYEHLRIATPKLEATVENLIEECNAIEQSNRELRKQKLDLHEHCSLLDGKLKESHLIFTDCSKRVEELEENISSLWEDFNKKEKILTSELDALLEENRKHKEKLIVNENLLNQMNLEKTVEVENLQEEVEQLTKQLSAMCGERERMASESMQELSILSADKEKLEYALQKLQAKVKWTEDELDIMKMDSETKLLGLMHELDDSVENREMLKAENELVLKLMENYESDEVKLKIAVNDLELKLTVSEYERQQLMEETTKMNVQLHKIADLQDDVLAFRNKLDATKCEKEKLEAALKLVSGECEDLKIEKNSFLETISNLKKAICELEDCKRSRVTLEEKLLRMEGDLAAKEELSAQDVEVKNELIRIKRANIQYQRKIKLLEEEKDECIKRCRALEEDMKLLKEERQQQRDSRGTRSPGFSKTNAKQGPGPIHKDIKLLNNDIGKNNGQNHSNRRKPSSRNGQAQEVVKQPQDPRSNQYQTEEHVGSEIDDETPRDIGVDPYSRIQLLENELAEATEANKKYKLQLYNLLSEPKNNQANSPKSTV